MKIAAVQINCQPADPKHNTEHMIEFCQKAKEQGAELVVLPELADVGYSFDQLKAVASNWDEGPLPELKRAAKDLELNIITGLTEKTEEGIYNSAAVINTQGELIASYRKTHLFVHGEIDESKRFLPGHEFCQFELNGLKFGLAICYDLRFPELFRELVVGGAEIIILPTAWPFPREEHLKALVTARAIENQVYFVACNRVGQDFDVVFSGHSRIVAPNGHILVAAGEQDEAIIMIEIDKASLDQIRSAMPVFSHRREDLY